MNNYIILDTETTGLDNNAEIVEIAVIDMNGEILLDTLIKPMRPIPAGATAIHGITNEMVTDAPTYDQIHPKLIKLLEKYPCGIYNESYDVRLIRQTSALYGITFDSRLYKFWCVMLDYANAHQEGVWAKLGYAYQHAIQNTGAEAITLTAHRAVADCLMALEVVKFLSQTEATT